MQSRYDALTQHQFRVNDFSAHVDGYTSLPTKMVISFSRECEKYLWTVSYWVCGIAPNFFTLTLLTNKQMNKKNNLLRRIQFSGQASDRFVLGDHVSLHLTDQVDRRCLLGALDRCSHEVDRVDAAGLR